MQVPKTFREKASEYGDLRKSASDPVTGQKYGDLERSLGQMADNEEWIGSHRDQIVSGTQAQHSEELPMLERSQTVLAQEEEHILRCLGAAVVLRWDQLPTTVQRELFDIAGSVGPLSDTAELRANIARFLHTYGNPAEHS